jgi:NADPH:quinone reductase-like Zn-dependent oxidoreductase
MRAIGFTEFGGPEVLKVVDLPEPEPGPGEGRIRVHAAGVNPTDITFRPEAERGSWRRARLPTCCSRRSQAGSGVRSAGLRSAIA